MKNIAIFIFCLLVVAWGFQLVSSSQDVWAGWFIISVMGPCALVAASQFYKKIRFSGKAGIKERTSPSGVMSKKLLIPGARLVLDEKGILDRSFHVGVIAWEDIEEINVSSVSDNKFINILVRDPDRYLGKLSPIQQYFSSINVQMGFGKFMINPKGLQATADRLIEEIESMWSKKVIRKDDEEIKILKD